MMQQFWVIGAEFISVDCEALVPGTSRVFGPFQNYRDAQEVWRERSQASRAQATTRYSIVASAANAARG